MIHEDVETSVLQTMINAVAASGEKGVQLTAETFLAIAQEALQWRELVHTTKYGPNSTGANISSENAASRCRDAMITLKSRIGAMDPKARSGLVTRIDMEKWHEAVYQSHVELQRLSQPNCFCLLDPKSLQEYGVPDYLGYFLSVKEGIEWYKAHFQVDTCELRFHATTLCGVIVAKHASCNGVLEEEVRWESMEVRF